MEIFGQRLRLLREEAGEVLQDVADRVSKTRTAPALWEAGSNEPSFAILVSLADYYGVTTDWLLGRPDAARDTPAVASVKAGLRQYIEALRHKLAGSTPGERVRLVLDYLADAAPQFEQSRLERAIGVRPGGLTAVVEARYIPGPELINRLARIAGLEADWFIRPL